jgi:hypothetical protein
MKKEVGISPILNNLRDYFGLAFELFLPTSNIKKEICDLSNSFILFIFKYEKNHNIFSLMLNLRFKSFHLVFHLLS